MNHSRLPATSSLLLAPSGLAGCWRLLAAAAVLTTLLGACATPPRPAFPAPLRQPNPEAAPEVEPEADAGARSRPRIEPGPTIVSPPIPAVITAAPPTIPVDAPVTLSLDGVPLSAFINVVFGSELGFSLEIDQAVRQRPELVSLRLVEPTRPQRLYTIAEEVLARYGVQVTEGDGVLHFGPAAQAGATPPRLITARALPDVPAGERPVFVAMPLDVSRPGQVAAQVRSLFGAQKDLNLSEMVEANALLISGPPASVQAAMEAVEVLDRASLRDQHSLRINPLYVAADVLATELRAVLEAQGFAVRSGSGSGGVLALVPVASANALVIFSESEPALAAATEWVERLDQPGDDSAGGGVYLYAARHTTVETLLPVLQALVGGSSAAASETALPGGAQGPAAGARPTVLGGPLGQLAVDPIRNVIVFQGEAERWRAIRGLLARLDQPARQVVIEVTIAEITLTDEFAHGVEWALRNVGFNGFEGSLSALAGAAVNPGGVVWSPISSSGQVRAIVNLFASDSRVTILSTPRLLVKSGSGASIDVGTEVPIITSQATAADLPFDEEGGSSILQSIQYRKTGVLLEIDAVVHSGQRVDLELTQEVSEATQTDTSEISSPSIFSRRLSTSVSLSDGQSMLLGGLISSSRTDGASKVPGLGDIPVLGRLFQNRRLNETRTELLMLITPYVVEDASQARAITDAIRSRFGGEVP